MPRPLLSALILFSASLCVCTQSHAKTKHQRDFNLWPTDIRRGADLRVYLRNAGLDPTPCHLISIDADHITCSGAHHAAASFDRTDVAAIEWPHHAFPPKALFLIGGSLVFLGGGCSVDNGPPCITPEAIGLTAIVGGLVLHIVQSTHSQQTPYVYVAPPLPQPLPPAPSQP